MTLLEVIVALVVFALAGMALMQASTQQAVGIGWMEEKVLANLAGKWLGREDDQLRWHRMVFTLARAGQRRVAAALLRGRGTAY